MPVSHRDHVRDSLQSPELGTPALRAWPLQLDLLAILELLVDEKVQPPGTLRLPKPADALLKPPASCIPDAMTKDRPQRLPRS